MPLGITNDCAPVHGGSGFNVLGHDARPQTYTTLCADPEFGSGQAPAGNELLVLPRQEASEESRADYKYDLTVNAPEDAVEATRTSFVPSDETVKRAQMNARVFGAGAYTPYRAEKPPQGIQTLRESINVPIDSSIDWAKPTHAGWNDFRPASALLADDPRFRMPEFIETATPLGAANHPNNDPVAPMPDRSPVALGLSG